jgi:proteasome accessory factor B
VQVEGSWGRDATVRALRKLAGVATGEEGAAGGAGDDLEAVGLAALPGGDAVAVAFGAIGERRRLAFSYRGEARVVDPWRLSFRRGQWYLAGFDHGRGEERLFRLDRVEGPLSVDGPPGSFARPPGGDAAPPPAWRIGDDDEMVAELVVDAHQARWAVDALGEDTVKARGADGSVVFEVGVTNVGAFRSFVLGFLDHAEIIGPPDLRADMVAWLAGVACPPSPAGGADAARAASSDA